MMIIEKIGNIFTTKCQTIVNTINCVGVMGAGIAYEFRLREPKMFEKYKELCSQKSIDIGILWIYKTDKYNILNFPTKYDWKYPSKEEYLHKGLQKFVDTYKQKNITSVAFPLLGADRGGIPAQKSQAIMEQYLSQCDIDVEIWHFDPTAKDDMYEEFKAIFQEIDDNTIKTDTKIRIDIVKKIRNALNDSQINSLSGLLRVKGVGDKSLEKLFSYIKSYKSKNLTLFDFDN
jgi:O-acetyl-ADP-ribose deacetylase (regulator of RNase III)